MLPPATHYMPDYVDEACELALLHAIDNSAWLGDLKRRVQHYGFRYDYRARRVTDETRLGPLPDWLEVLAGRLWKDSIFQAQPDQVIVNEYLPGRASPRMWIASLVLARPSRRSVLARRA